MHSGSAIALTVAYRCWIMQWPLHGVRFVLPENAAYFYTASLVLHTIGSVSSLSSWGNSKEWPLD
jgi:hypothetical protein